MPITSPEAALLPPGNVWRCGGLVTVDVTRLESIDGHSVALLARRAEKVQVDGTTIRVVGRNYILRRLWELLRLDPAVMDGVS